MIDKQTTCEINFEIQCIGSDQSFSEKFTTQVYNQLLYLNKNINIKRSSSSEPKQGAGDLLSILLAGPAVIVIAKGIADYIRNRMYLTIILRKGSKSIQISGSSKDVSKLITDFLFDI